ncbi:chromate transporter [Oxalobacteraceae bacterium R-40]|uniref:Chromate transporter n=1 Tax=Keguizhuia sedimenti TaxID=3064264 RepID=A0ABU1BKD3_9BURK|nr:chromate transporter [Oxalobacteraceae bacterium R-40]
MPSTDLPASNVRPQSLRDLFTTFTLLALQGFGGVLAVTQHELVERKRWLTREEFIEELAVAQIMPGPNVINLSIMLGARYFGWRGALASLAGMLILPMIVVLSLAVVYAQFAQHAEVAGALRGMGAVAAGLIVSSGLRLLPTLRHNALGLTACYLLGGLCLVAVAVLRWPLLYVLPVLGVLSCTLTYMKLKP